MNSDSILERLERQALDPEHQAKLRAEQAVKDAERQRMLGIARAKAIAATGIPLMFVEKISGELQATQAISEANGTGTGVVVLSGLPGCGKSIAACAWVREPLLSDRAFEGIGIPQLAIVSPLFVTSARLARWERYSEGKMDSLLKATRLVVDDVGAEYSDVKGNFLAILDELIADRAANRRPMILTTNLDAAAFKLRYGERIADRIREVGRFVSIDGGSLRKRTEAA